MVHFMVGPDFGRRPLVTWNPEIVCYRELITQKEPWVLRVRRYGMLSE